MEPCSHRQNVLVYVDNTQQILSSEDSEEAEFWQTYHYDLIGHYFKRENCSL